jgi:hypothetical protein
VALETPSGAVHEPLLVKVTVWDEVALLIVKA